MNFYPRISQSVSKSSSRAESSSNAGWTFASYYTTSLALCVKGTHRMRASNNTQFRRVVMMHHWPCWYFLTGRYLLPYRSTSSSDVNNDNLLELLHMAVDESNNSQVLQLMGDFSYPEINYNEYNVTGRDDSCPSKFFHACRISFSFSVIERIWCTEIIRNLVFWITSSLTSKIN